jgi:hypothetical protein
MAERSGARTWYFPDGDIPPPGEGGLRGHESLLILNPGETAAKVRITVYYEDREADMLETQVVGARRVRCIRTDEPIGDVRIPFGQYALKVEASVPVICQIGRMDVRQANLAYYTVLGHPAD